MPGEGSDEGVQHAAQDVSPGGDVDEPAAVAVDARPRRLSTALIVVAAVLAIVSTLTTWVRSEMLDTDEWVEISSGLLAEPEVQDALTVYLSNQIFERVDLESSLSSLLPEPLNRLAGPLSGALRQPITDGIATLIASERFGELWEDANRAAHARMVAILRDETRPGVSTTDGTVTLDLATIVQNVGERLGIPTDALDRLPDDAGQVVIFESDQLASMQTVVQVLDFMSWFLFVVVVLLYVVAVWVAGGAWRVALRNVGISLAVAGVTLLILRAIGIRAVVGAVVSDPRNEPLGGIVGRAATHLVGEAAWTGIVYGVLIALFATLIGPHRWAVSVRRFVGRATESVGAAIAVGALAILLLLWWSPGETFDRFVSSLVFVCLAVGAVVAMLVISRREYRASSAVV